MKYRVREVTYRRGERPNFIPEYQEYWLGPWLMIDRHWDFQCQAEEAIRRHKDERRLLEGAPSDKTYYVD